MEKIRDINGFYVLVNTDNFYYSCISNNNEYYRYIGVKKVIDNEHQVIIVDVNKRQYDLGVEPEINMKTYKIHFANWSDNFISSLLGDNYVSFKISEEEFNKIVSEYLYEFKRENGKELVEISLQDISRNRDIETYLIELEAVKSSINNLTGIFTKRDSELSCNIIQFGKARDTFYILTEKIIKLLEEEKEQIKFRTDKEVKNDL